MRTKLTEIIATFDSYNEVDESGGLENYVDIVSDLITSEHTCCTVVEDEGMVEIIKEFLYPNGIVDGTLKPISNPSSQSTKNEYVLTYEEFLNEQRYKGTPSNIQSYFGGIDDEDEEEE